MQRYKIIHTRIIQLRIIYSFLTVSQTHTDYKDGKALGVTVSFGQIGLPIPQGNGFQD